MQYYENELDEILMQNNPNGGRPMRPGGLVFKDSEGRTTYDVDRITENVIQRFFLGYCPCGRKVVIGEKRAEILMKALEKKGVRANIPKVPVRVRLARRLAGM